jgi:hypothetical protein
MSLIAKLTLAPLILDERGDLLENDFFAESFITKKFQAFDKGLFSTKWFDYRFMTSLQATYTYINAYGPIYQRLYAREFDKKKAEFVKPLTVERVREGLQRADAKTRRMFVGMWRGRQFADALGMPYPVYIQEAFTFRMRHWQQKYMPQPQHLYSENDLEHIQVAWLGLQNTKIWYSDHHAYIHQNYADIPAQNDYHEWLITQARMRQHSVRILADMANRDHLPADKIRARLAPNENDDFENNLRTS